MKIKQKETKRTELQRLLSKRGVASRRDASVLVRSGKVKVNGRVETDPLAYISINAKLEIEGIDKAEKVTRPVLIAFHKPRGVVTTTSDEKGRKTVYDLLPQEYRHLKAVGRLDMASTGLLLFTNDNSLADSLLDPKNEIPRTYVVSVKGKVGEKEIGTLLSGVIYERTKLYAREATIRKSSNKESILIITLVEGKNRAVRKMCEVIGHEVIKLKRVSFGHIELGDLKPGEIRDVPPYLL